MRHSVSTRQRPPLLWAWLGMTLGLLLALPVFAPAAWLASAVAAASGQRVLLADTQGTLWKGSAQLLLTGGPGSQDAAALPERLHWQIQPLLRPTWLGLRVQLSAACCTPAPLQLQWRLHWAGAQITLADQTSAWPAGLLAGLGTPWNTVQAEGTLALASQGLSVEWNAGQMVIAGRAQLQANQMASRLSTLRPMGSYRILLTGGTPSTIQLDTLEGSLQLTGQGTLAGSQLRFTGSASAAPEREAALSNLLNIIGRRNGAQSIITLG